MASKDLLTNRTTKIEREITRGLTSPLHLYIDEESKRTGTVPKNLLDSLQYTGFLGILICIEITRAFFQDLVMQGKLKYYFPSSGLTVAIMITQLHASLKLFIKNC